MEQYEKIRELGSGSYGDVFQALDKKSGEFVAVKKLKKKIFSLDESRNLKEVKCLRKMNNHPNIVKLRNLVKEHEDVFIVFEYMESDLLKLMKERAGQNFSEDEVRNLCFQVFRGLHYMHRQGYFHRDLKPSNLLVSKGVIKIGDLGMVKEIDSSLPCTDYVTTRWYRAPEVLLLSEIYGPEVDMWAMGAIMFEMLSFRILFPGKNSADQIYRICQVIGRPTENSWPLGIQLASNLNWKFPQMGGVNQRELLPSASRESISLISWLCSWNPHMRPTAAEALEHPFFRSCHFVPRSVPLLCNNFEAVAFPTATVTMQGRSLTYSEVPNDGQLCPCFKCEMQRTNNDQWIINSAKSATSMIYKTGHATTTEILASRMQPLQQLMMSRPPGF
ncbi:hypothetical protein CICLE_v10017752mg [Citrus x clementina]|uniref:Protein kinase domain-containing protein n=1 Tax=Citrus clementina TaxID=85681 RepID=V4W044_CITCL|nr:cyclin-dependent kinase F-4 [Citrus x clementina]ESR59144.1 hypothetical protein CICLE_v10017752mg [Citrus x clementina]